MVGYTKGQEKRPVYATPPRVCRAFLLFSRGTRAMGDTMLGAGMLRPSWAAVYDAYERTGDYRRVASDLGMNYHTVRGYVSKARACLRSLENSAPAESVGTKAEKVPTPRFKRDYPEKLTDRGVWSEVVAELRDGERPFTVVNMPDLHIPDHNEASLYMALRVIEEVKPDLVPYTGDVLDLDILSRFDPPILREYPEDVLEEARPVFNWVSNQVQAKSRNSRQLVLGGNHDRRRMNATQRALFYTIEQAFVSLLRQDGRVMWLGPKQEILLDTMLLQHGERAGVNAAKNSWKDVGYGFSHVQAHNHKFGWSVMRQYERGWEMGSYRLITAASTGCLCNIPPAYREHSDIADWVQGTALIHVYPLAGIANVTPIPFHPYRGGMMAFVGTKVLTV